MYYIHYGNTLFDRYAFKKIQNHPFMAKPEGGFWASRVDARYGWKEWSSENDFGECKEENSFVFTLKENAKILEIHSVYDLEGLPRLEIKEQFRAMMWEHIDYEKLAKEYDAIEIFISDDRNLYWSLYGWDCDSIVIMNPNVIVEVER